MPVYNYDLPEYVAVPQFDNNWLTIQLDFNICIQTLGEADYITSIWLIPFPRFAPWHIQVSEFSSFSFAMTAISIYMDAIIATVINTITLW